jgi:hypothetical protein
LMRICSLGTIADGLDLLLRETPPPGDLPAHLHEALSNLYRHMKASSNADVGKAMSNIVTALTAVVEIGVEGAPRKVSIFLSL